MHPPPLPFHRAAALLLLALAAPLAAALTPTEWRYRQPVEVAAPGLVRIAVPASTFDLAQPGLADLRVTDAAGREVPYFLDRDPLAAEAGATPGPRSAATFAATQADGLTRLTLGTGTDERLDAIELQTDEPYFLKAAHVSVSADGLAWESLGPAVPLFRQFGAEQLRIAIGRPAAFVQVALDDRHARPVRFTGARVRPAPAQARPPVLDPLGARIVRRDEFAGETVLTVELDGRHVPVRELALETREPLFMRRVTVAVREVNDGVPGERIVGAGTVYRVALDGVPPQAQLGLPVAFAPGTREILVHLHHGDSPPLALDGVSARQHPVHLTFMAAAAGPYRLLTGNPQASAPRYDLAAFARDLRQAAGTFAVPGAPEPTPDYQPRASLAEPPLPEVPLAGAPLDTKYWAARKAVHLARPGVQELELDPETLARARSDLADLRLLHGGNQVPYILERTTLSRSLTLEPVAVPDPKRPTVSVWRLTLPQAGLPLRRLVLTSSTPLFQRQLRLYEQVSGPGGGTVASPLAAGEWSRTPAPGVPETRVFDLPARLRTDTIWIETDNGDNPAVALGRAQATYPVVRLVFKVAETEGFALAFGNDDAAAPRYDLSLVAGRLLTASRSVATLAAAGPNPAARTLFGGLKASYLFWGALALVVVVLLFVVAKALPKPAA
ncbi:MAG: DUF3999 family protein [Opitutaceae bacterium]|nr:DUF3999 family protein [Opitutaceae bacterium]